MYDYAEHVRMAKELDVEDKLPAHGNGSGEGKPPRVVRGGDYDHGTVDRLCGSVKGGHHEVIA